MGKRFSRIKHAFKPVDKGGLGAPQTSDVFVKFSAFRNGTGTYEVKGTKRGATIPGVLQAFSLPKEEKKVLVLVTGRSTTGMAATGLSETELNLKIGRNQVDDGRKIKGFQPARAICFVSSVAQSGATQSPTSKITGIEYKKRLGQSLTLPFGRDSAGQTRQTYSEMQAYLIGKSNPGVSISFKPEIPS